MKLQLLPKIIGISALMTGSITLIKYLGSGQAKIAEQFLHFVYLTLFLCGFFYISDSGKRSWHNLFKILTGLAMALLIAYLFFLGR